MSLILFNKPYGVMSQFSTHESRATLADYVPHPDIYPAGRLDADSEGLMLLTNNGKLQHEISHPESKKQKTYLAQVEGIASVAQLKRLREPLGLGDFTTIGCHAARIETPIWLWERQPPVRTRAQIPTSWLVIRLVEGKNRQVRRMTAAVGLPTLRLIRSSIGPFSLANHPLMPGEWLDVGEDAWHTVK